MINWNEFEHIHVIKKLKHVLQTWWNIDIVFTDERGQLKGLDSEKITYANPAVNYLLNKESTQQSLAELVSQSINDLRQSNNRFVFKKWDAVGFDTCIFPIIIENDFVGTVTAMGFFKEENSVQRIGEVRERLAAFACTSELIENDSLYTLKASGIAVTFSKKDGKIRKVANDLGFPLPFSNGPVLLSGNARLESIQAKKGEKSCSLEMNYSGDMKRVIWTMFSSGWLALDYEYQVAGEQKFCGISFDFPESDVIGAKWLGKGPAHVWKNRMAGGVLDVYQRMYNNRLPADNSWGLPQFKGYFPEVSWMEFNTVDGKFTVVAQEDDLFVRLFNFYGISGPKNYPELPVGDISFLDAIPPIGTKLAMGISNDTWNLGPMGELNKMDKPVKRTLYFYFGLIN